MRLHLQAGLSYNEGGRTLKISKSVDVPDGLPVTEIVHAKGRPPKEVTIDVLNALARAILASVQARKAAAPPAAQAT